MPVPHEAFFEFISPFMTGGPPTAPLHSEGRQHGPTPAAHHPARDIHEMAHHCNRLAVRQLHSLRLALGLLQQQQSELSQVAVAVNIGIGETPQRSGMQVASSPQERSPAAVLRSPTALERSLALGSGTSSQMSAPSRLSLNQGEAVAAEEARQRWLLRDMERSQRARAMEKEVAVRAAIPTAKATPIVAYSEEDKKRIAKLQRQHEGYREGLAFLRQQTHAATAAE